MQRVLTVDDSRAIRLIVTKNLTELGCEVDEAEDGNEGLAKLKSGKYDLVLLDVTMPNLDGPSMLTRMRERGDSTPVLMLTSESKTSIVAALIRLGIEDYVLKPFKPEELRAKVTKALKLATVTQAVAAAGAPEPAPAPAPSPPPQPAATNNGPSKEGATVSAKGKVDVLVIDDMENVHKKLKSILPSSLGVDGCLNAGEGLALARVRSYRMVLVDSEIPDVNVATYIKQMRILQPNATCLGMALRGAPTLSQEMRELGFDDVLTKPFTPEVIDSLIEQHFAGADESIVREDNVLRICAFHGREDRAERHYAKLSRALKDAIEALGEACYDEAILDAVLLPTFNVVRASQFIAEAVAMSGKIGVALRLVASPEVEKALRGFEETKGLRCFGTLAQARAMLAA